MAGEGLTFAVDFKDGTFNVPLATGVVQSIVVLIFSILTSLALIIYALIQYFNTLAPRKRYYKQLLTPVQYIPPKSLTVAESAEIYLKKTKPSQVATILELAVSHRIELVKSDDDKTWSINLKNLDHATNAELDVLKILSGDTSLIKNGQSFTVKKHSATRSAETLARDYQTSTKQLLINHQLLASPAPKNHATIAAIIGFFVSILPFILFVVFDHALPFFLPVAAISPLLILGLVSLIVWIWTASYNKYLIRTDAGLDTANYLEGLKQYISLAEADRLKFLQSVKGADTSTQGIVKLYERLLPYACIFGLEKSWLVELNRYYEQNDDLTPVWYAGVGYLSLHDFNSFSRSTMSSYSSSSSYSSGSGGGGFSGGGGGGGSTGSW